MNHEYSTGQDPREGDRVQHYVDLDEGVVASVRVVGDRTIVGVRWSADKYSDPPQEHHADELSLRERVMTTGELRQGMTVACHGMKCLIDQPISRRESTQQYGPGDDFVYWTPALVLNRDEVSSDDVPLSFTAPDFRNPHRLIRDEDGNVDQRHRWNIQGNNNARWLVIDGLDKVGA